jgi:4'-phosphopantetheinyl transferase
MMRPSEQAEADRYAHATGSAASGDTVLPLDAGAIHVWLASADDVSDDDLPASYRDLLDAVEQARERRLRCDRDRRRYLLARALVRVVLSRYVPIHPREWAFSPDPLGRPTIVNRTARDAGLSFNLSYARSLVVLGVTRRGALGVDVETLCPPGPVLELAARYFSPDEATALAATPVEGQRRRFVEYWTLKEAYAKARGMGLSLPLDKVSFRFPSDREVQMVLHPELADEPARWQLWQAQPTADHLLAICAERARGRPSRLIARRVLPLLSETECALEIVRISEGGLSRAQ